MLYCISKIICAIAIENIIQNNSDPSGYKHRTFWEDFSKDT